MDTGDVDGSHRAAGPAAMRPGDTDRDRDRDLDRGPAAGPGQQSYRSPAHFRCLLDGLLGLREGAVLFDVVLLVEGRPLPAHRVLLAASCDYFRGMFAGGLRETQQKEVPIHGVSHLGMKKILDYIYTSEIHLDLDNVHEVLTAATLVQLENVIGFCCDFLFSWLDETNVLEVLRLADLYGLQQLKTRVHVYLLRNIRTLCRAPVYRQLPAEEVFKALSSDELQVHDENQVLEAALLYHCGPEGLETEQDYERVNAQEHPKMLEAVRFGLMEKPVLQRLLGPLGPGLLREAVSAALRYHEQELWQPVLQTALTRPRAALSCVLAFGGMFSSSSPPDADHLFQVFHPGWGAWRSLPAAATAPRMSNQGIAVLHGFVYLIGGDRNTSGFRAEARCWRYDPRHHLWCAVQPLQQQHADHCVCVVGGHIYAIGGRDYSNALDTVERYDPHANKWEFVAPLKREVYAHAGAVSGGLIYVTCGRRGNTYLRETYRFDPAANQWAACAEGPVERAWHGMAAANGRVYVIGGSNDQQGYRRDVLKVACLDPSTDSWSLVAPLPSGHGEPGVAVLDGRVFVLGGRSHNQGNRTKNVHVYDCGADRWSAATGFTERVSGTAACAAPLPPAVAAQARSWERRSKASWEEEEEEEEEEGEEQGASSED